MAALYQSGAAGRRSSGIREILAKLEFNIFKNVAHRTGATIFSEHCLRTLRRWRFAITVNRLRLESPSILTFASTQSLFVCSCDLGLWK